MRSETWLVFLFGGILIAASFVLFSRCADECPAVPGKIKQHRQYQLAVIHTVALLGYSVLTMALYGDLMQTVFNTNCGTVDIFNTICGTVDIFKSNGGTVEIFNSICGSVETFNTNCGTAEIYNTNCGTVEILNTNCGTVELFNSI